MPARVPGSFYKPELDALRFFAFFAVFLHHTLPAAGEGFALLAPLVRAIRLAGAYGVDLFFVLSSYLITELLLREMDRFESVRVRDFYVRRLLRIWPLYFTFIGIALCLPLWYPQQNFSWTHALAFTFFSGNWLFVVPTALNSVAIPLWSISVEEQFYLAWPLVVRRADRLKILKIAFGLIAVAFLTRSLLVYRFPDIGVWNNTFARLDPIAFGAILAVRLRGGASSAGAGMRVGMIVAGLATVLLVAGLCPMGEFPLEWGVQIGYPLIALACAVIVYSCILPPNVKPAGRIFDALVYLGKISYGLYVFHKLALLLVKPAFAGKTGMIYQAMYFVTGLTLTVVMAAISYRYLEAPFLKLKQRFTHVRSRPEFAPPSA